MKNKVIIAGFAVAVAATLCLLGYVTIRTAIKADAQREAATGMVNGGSVANACTNLTQSVMTIGKDLSNRLVATSSKRAWVRIQMDKGATTTALLTFAGDATSTAANATVLLNAGNLGGASSTPFVTFGLNTDMPYTGSVGGLSAFGTSTVLVTQCSY